MNSLENLSILLVFPDLAGKTKLMEVLRSVLYKGHLHYERSLKELDKKLSDPIGTKYDVIFISAKFPHKEISEFLKSIMLLANPKMPSIIVCLSSISSQSSGAIASWYVEGVSGFISDPYTAQDLTELLNSVLQQHSKHDPLAADLKARKASKFLMTDAMSLIDEVARLSFEGKRGGYALKDLKALSKTFADAYAQDPLAYETALIETFEKAKPPSWAKEIIQKKVKSKMAQHPGVLVWSLMSKHGISEDRLVGLLRTDAESISALLRGQFEVDEKLAQHLSRVFGMSPREWLKMQMDFNAYQVARKEEDHGG